ncbi:hypothetical protein RJT34_20172 [Clitoria ternatea]|uniref:Uncharacterized protein n=1 Tax=Clitoria ternatea TaxID=43366 RepID=A0AAN9ISE0_CLITE
MEKKTTSSSSICWKIRKAFAINPAFKVIHRIKHYYQEPSPRPLNTLSNSPSLPPPQYHPSQNLKTNNKIQQGEGVIPIKFDYSTPSSTLHGQVSKVASPQVGRISETKGKVDTKVEPQPFYFQGSKAGVFKGEKNDPLKEQHGVGMLQEQQGKKTLDINDTFSEYIQRAKCRIRTVSNIGGGQSNSVSNEAKGSSGNNNRMENQRDHFSDFIQHAKKKIRTTSSLGKTTSLKRG